MAITNQTSLSAGASTRQIFSFLKGFANNALGSFYAGSAYSLWDKVGYPAPGATNPSSAIPTNLTAGAFPLADAAGGNQLYLGKMHARQNWWVSGGLTSPARIVLRLYDRLYHSGVTFTSASQTITLSGPTVTRGLANGIGNEIWFEEWQNVPAGSTSVTYVNDGGTNSTTAAFQWSSIASDGSNGRMAQLPRLTADKGVQSIVSLATAGISFPPHQVAILILREIAQYAFNFTEFDCRDALDLGLPQIDNGSCLFLASECPVSAPNQAWGIMGRIEIYQQ